MTSLNCLRLLFYRVQILRRLTDEENTNGFFIFMNYKMKYLHASKAPTAMKGAGHEKSSNAPTAKLDATPPARPHQAPQHTPRPLEECEDDDLD